MKYFKQIYGLPTTDLYNDLSTMLINQTVDFSSMRQICLNTVPSQPDNFKLGTGSLQYDWTKVHEMTNPDGTVKSVPVEYDTPYNEEDFTILCSQFKNTAFEEMYNVLSKNYKLGRVRLMKMNLRYCMSWHTDTSCRLHYPIKTQPGCFMVIEDEVMHLPQNQWWMTNTTKHHTAFNGSNEDRIHLVAAILDYAF